MRILAIIFTFIILSGCTINIQYPEQNTAPVVVNVPEAPVPEIIIEAPAPVVQPKPCLIPSLIELKALTKPNVKHYQANDDKRGYIEDLQFYADSVDQLVKQIRYEEATCENR